MFFPLLFEELGTRGNLTSLLFPPLLVLLRIDILFVVFSTGLIAGSNEDLFSGND